MGVRTLSDLVRVRIREAIAQDKGHVLDFCKNTWTGGDYIADVWDEWLGDQKGRLVVATLGVTPVAVAHASFQTRRVVWLEGLRVNPMFRGRGIAGRLNRALTTFAAQKGAVVARLCTGSRNTASRRHTEKVGFKILRSFERLESEKGLLGKPAGVVRPRTFQADFWKWTKNSREYYEYRGLFSDGWTWYPLTISSFKRLVNSGQVLQTRKKGALASCCVFGSEGRRLTLGFAAGIHEDVEDEARYLRHLLSRDKQEMVRALVPTGSSLVRALEDAGFERSTTILVYEKNLRADT